MAWQLKCINGWTFSITSHKIFFTRLDGSESRKGGGESGGKSWMERRVDRNTSHSAKNSETLNWLIRFENFLRKLPENVSCRISEMWTIYSTFREKIEQTDGNSQLENFNKRKFLNIQRGILDTTEKRPKVPIGLETTYVSIRVLFWSLNPV